MESPQQKERIDKCDEIRSDTSEDKNVFELEDEIEIKFDDKETVENLEIVKGVATAQDVS